MRAPSAKRGGNSKPCPGVDLVQCASVNALPLTRSHTGSSRSMQKTRGTVILIKGKVPGRCDGVNQQGGQNSVYNSSSLCTHRFSPSHCFVLVFIATTDFQSSITRSVSRRVGRTWPSVVYVSTNEDRDRKQAPAPSHHSSYWYVILC